MKVLARIAVLAAVTPLVLAATTPAPLGGEQLQVTGTAVVDDSPEVPDLPDIDAAAWLVADLDTGAVLAARDAHVPLPPASTIKMLTAIVLLTGVDPDIAYAATPDDANVDGSRVGLVPEETYSKADLAHGLMLASGNDAAHAIAEIAGGQAEAVEAMNAEAARLGAFTTQAKTPHGLDEPSQVSSAYDLALLARATLADDALAELVQTRTYDFPGLDGETSQIQNPNRLLGSYDGAIGVKNGYTSDAGYTLAAAAERDGVRLVVTVLNPDDGRAEPVAAELLDWGFDAVSAAEPVGDLITPEEVAEAVAAEQVPEATDAEADTEESTTSSRAARGIAGGLDTRTTVAGGTAALSALLLLVLLRRRRRRPRRPNGRYAA